MVFCNGITNYTENMESVSCS